MILLDANILLELLISGRPRRETVASWLQRNREDFCISMLTVHLVLHFGALDGLTLAELQRFLADYPKIALLPDDYESAMQLARSRDYEDALQLAVAQRMGCTKIITLDRKFARTYEDRIEFMVLR